MMWSDNPERDAERYFSDLEDADRQCLHCVFCGGSIADGDDYYDIGDDMVMCEDCLNDHYRKVANYD